MTLAVVAAMVVPILADGRVVLERIYRYTVEQTVVECPSGGLDGEPPDVAARRELLEETGYRAGRVEPLGSYFGSNGISNERFHLFLASDLVQTGPVAREATEQMEVWEVPLPDAVRMARAGEIACGPSALALLLAAERLERGRARRGGGRGRRQPPRPGRAARLPPAPGPTRSRATR